MSKIASYQHGQFSWIDLMTPDPPASKLFYSAAFGWSHVDTPTDQGGVYTQFLCEDLPVAGMGELAKHSGARCHWNSYVNVNDADAIAARCEQLGGNVEMPVMQVMTAGRMTFLEDPTGARFGIWQKGDHIGARLTNAPVSCCWNELNTRDVDAAKRFYADLFGWTFQTHTTGPTGQYHEIQNRGRSNGGLIELRKERGHVPAQWLPYLAVEDCDAAVAKIEKAGGKRMMPSVDIPAGRFAMVNDPHGAFFYVMRLANPE